ncbi:CPBP family intramembrane glutamic endopeptidase [Amphibacillus sediminis]|uniref:CPBP family intramembrane glutamic endopeptidase n=1 Tax=Amphibacillus sediminis TaxID=360185 RepID=UPI000831D140|nr:CPBP family intramembrane glutamic endopeptidase [Amphibacillus sediminis]
MPMRYIGIILTYIVAQLSGIPIASWLQTQNITESQYMNFVLGWQVASFVLALIITLLLLKPEKQLPRDPNRASLTMTIIWSILGFFMVMFGQMIVNLIQMLLFNIDEQSQNTENLMGVARVFPIFIVVIAIIGPILEEIIFRKIIFGELYKRTNFLVAGVISGLIFAVIHNDFTHLLVYFMMSFVFAFIYVETKRIIVPIIAHMLMNTFVVIAQLVILPQLEQTTTYVQMILIGG